MSSDYATYQNKTKPNPKMETNPPAAKEVHTKVTPLQQGIKLAPWGPGMYFASKGVTKHGVFGDTPKFSKGVLVTSKKMQGVSNT